MMPFKASPCRIVFFLACITVCQGFPFFHLLFYYFGHHAFQLVRPKVCYDGIGCFGAGGNFFHPLIRPVQLLPQSPQAIRPTYGLYTRKNVNNSQYLVYGKAKSVFSSNFNPKVPTKIIIHGFLVDETCDWIIEMRRAFLHLGDFNVLQLDWSRGNRLPYAQATANTRVVGALVAQLIKWLESQFGANREDFHLLGHSLGSHISGYAGERLRDGSRQLGRITAMDPAGPYFENTHSEVRLDPTDARFVDAIHTDGDSLLSNVVLQGGFGMMQAVGHVDFYPNGGRKQPDCSPSKHVQQISRHGITKGIVWVFACDHERSHSLVISSIKNTQGNYKAFPCDSYASFKAGSCRDCGVVGCAQMGLRANEWNPREYKNVKMFLDTSGKWPFESTGKDV